MRTEEDLRDVFNHLAGTAPDADEVRASLHVDRRAAPRRRTALVLGTVVATTAAAVAVPLALNDRADQQEPTVATQRAADENWRTVLSVRPLTGFLETTRLYGQSFQYVGLLSKSPSHIRCSLTVHQNGHFDPATIPADSARVDVNGARGYVAVNRPDRPIISLPGRVDPAQPAAPVRAVIWQASPGLWATASCFQAETDTNAALQTALLVARRLSTSPHRLVSPYVVGYVPKNLPAIYHRSSATEPFAEVIQTQFSDGNPRTGIGMVSGKPSKLVTSSSGHRGPYVGGIEGNDLVITYVQVESELRQHRAAPEVTVNGRPGWWEPTFDGGTNTQTTLFVLGSGFGVRIASYGATPDRDEILKVARGLRFAADPHDGSTWFDATTALP